VGLVQKSASFKLDVSELSSPASEGHMAMRQERQSNSPSRPLDVSFYCECGSCLNLTDLLRICRESFSIR
jgi:hypothetical protein